MTTDLLRNMCIDRPKSIQRKIQASTVWWKDSITSVMYAIQSAMWSPLRNLTLKQTLLLKQPEVGQVIRELRQIEGLTQEQLAAVLGVAYGTINRWENGHIQPSPLALRQIQAVIEELNSR